MRDEPGDGRAGKPYRGTTGHPDVSNYRKPLSPSSGQKQEEVVSPEARPSSRCSDHGGSWAHRGRDFPEGAGLPEERQQLPHSGGREGEIPCLLSSACPLLFHQSLLLVKPRSQGQGSLGNVVPWDMGAFSATHVSTISLCVLIYIGYRWAGIGHPPSVCMPQVCSTRVREPCGYTFPFVCTGHVQLHTVGPQSHQPDRTQPGHMSLCVPAPGIMRDHHMAAGAASSCSPSHTARGGRTSLGHKRPDSELSTLRCPLTRPILSFEPLDWRIFLL